MYAALDGKWVTLDVFCAAIRKEREEQLQAEISELRAKLSEEKKSGVRLNIQPPRKEDFVLAPMCGMALERLCAKN